MRRQLILTLAASVLAACNLSVPQVTPTVAPSLTPSRTPPVSATPSLTPSQTATETANPTLIAQLIASQTATPSLTPTLTATATATHSPTPTATPTITQTPSRTPTFTPTATPTASDTPPPSATITPTETATDTPLPTDTPTLTPTFSATPSDTPTSTDTPLPTATHTPPPSPTPLPTVGPTDTPTSTPTDTPTLTLTATITPLPSLTPRPSATPTRTLSPVEIAQLQATAIPTFTPFPTGTPTHTLTAPPPTLDVTPTFITATSLPVNVPPVLATTTPFLLPTQPPLPTVTALPPVQPPTSLPVLPPVDPRTVAFVLDTQGQRGAVGLLPDVTLFERNPVNPAQYAVTDSSGLLYFTGINGENAGRVDVSPFSQFIPKSREENNAYVQDIAWSPNGQYLAFLINGDKLAADGVWFFGPGQFAPVQLLVDCPAQGHPGCGIVTSPSGPDFWESLALQWSPNSDALLVRTWIPSKNRAGLTVLPITQDPSVRDARPPVYEYEYGNWSNDGNRLLVSGSAPDGNNYIGWINRDGSFSELVFAARDAGLWMQNAVQRPDGSIVTLGAPSNEGGSGAAQRLYDSSGRALTGPIGGGPPTRVEWSPDRSAVLVIVGDRSYLARVDGRVDDITAEVGGARAINWVNGAGPFIDSPQITVAPVGQPSDNPYAAGTRVVVLAPAGLLVRTQPNTSAEVIASVLPGDGLIILPASPVHESSFVWFQVQTESGGVTGWVAGEIDGQPTIGT